ncbi:hypothetical protein [Aeromicrobium sp. 179-A 4D2 NHS]|uniref:hypothetical protein n=1 Tax=Aeromicrobium sp. 179-A 4D2 NHS TaxID=3142375 RepID=UPI0039A0B46A
MTHISDAAEARQRAARRPNGQFGEQHKPEPSPLSKAQAKRLAQEERRKSQPFIPTRQFIETIEGIEYAHVDGSNGPFYIRMDAITDETVEAYRTGQCLAFAIEAHRRTGWPIVARIWTAIEYDEAVNYPIHFYVRSPDGRLLDVGGYNDEDVVREDLAAEEQFKEFTDPNIAHELFHRDMQEQDYSTAHHIVPAALVRADSIDCGEFDPLEEWTFTA